MPTAMLNVRMPQELKTAGESVLKANGINATQAIRKFYEYLKNSQKSLLG
jgi:antitoxin component of RelBE/YafQ-DinJ toxin-antitoxin module